LQKSKRGMSGAALIAIILVIVLAAAGAYYVWANYGHGIVGSGNVVSRQFTVPGFTSVDVEDGFTANISYADYFMIRATTDDNIMERVSVTCANGTLHVGISQGSPITKTTALRLEVYMPVVAGIDFSGGLMGLCRVSPLRAACPWFSQIQAPSMLSRPTLGASTFPFRPGPFLRAKLSAVAVSPPTSCSRGGKQRQPFRDRRGHHHRRQRGELAGPPGDGGE